MKRLFLVSTALSLVSTAAPAGEVFVAQLAAFRTTTTATGVATLTLRDDLSAIDYVVTYADLTSPEIAAHVHRAGGEIAFDLGVGNPKVGTWADPTADDIAQLRNEEMYVNVHSEVYPLGEIRGTLLRQPVPVAGVTWSAIKARYR
jgi:hypothetical protein